MRLFPLFTLLVFALTLFVSASLLFLIEPMVGKMITPLLGGTPAVWNTCMVFFQAALLAGYAYAHFSTQWLGVRRQAVLQLVLLGVAFLFLSRLNIHRGIVESNVANPIPSLLLLLTTTIGVPFFVVSSSAPVLQKWFASTDNPAASDPYFLYGASNFGSMLALLGYPLGVEPFLTLAQQRVWWAWCYAGLVALTAGCAAFLWLAPATTAPKAAPPSDGEPQTLGGAVTTARRLHWVLLAAVPSSLMLGATTFMTTDIAAIPLLWVLPLALYLLSFILVFSKIPVWLQTAIVWFEVNLVIVGVATTTESLPLRALGSVLFVVSFLLFFLQRPDFLHRAHVVALAPAVLLTLLFTMQPEVKPESFGILHLVGLHLATLFIAAMVCHGELARDRPAPVHLTGYFLWMSFGGVVGGLFNALVAPIAFVGIAEYPLAMLAGCLLLPSAVGQKNRKVDFSIDLGLAIGLPILGLLLLGLRRADDNLGLGALASSTGVWLLLALAAGVVGAVASVLRQRERQLGWLDLALAAGLGVLALGLFFGVRSDQLDTPLTNLAQSLNLEVYQLRGLIAFGVPALFCCTFVGQPRRFGLGVGALLLASVTANAIEDPAMLQRRSFFGVLIVKSETHKPDEDDESTWAPRHWLMHGTTMHGEQFRRPDLRGIPSSYFTRSGPVGTVMAACNRADRPLGIIGLGTGTIATYALPAQTVTYYDIDPEVKKIAFDDDKYFSFVADAMARGAILDIVMGDARLTLDRANLQGEDRYGILVVDAFSSDAIPIHLLTKEAMEMYLRKVRDDGLILFHISNRYLDLKPVLANIAEATGQTAYCMEDDRDETPPDELSVSASVWVVLTRKGAKVEGFMSDESWKRVRPRTRAHLLRLSAVPDGGTGLSGLALALQQALKHHEPRWRRLATDPKVGVWTDDYSNLLRVFNWGRTAPAATEEKPTRKGSSSNSDETP